MLCPLPVHCYILAKLGVFVGVVEVKHGAEECEKDNDEDDSETEDVSKHPTQGDLERAKELADG